MRPTDRYGRANQYTSAQVTSSDVLKRDAGAPDLRTQSPQFSVGGGGNTGSAQAGQEGEQTQDGREDENDSAKQAQLAAQAKVTEAQAIAAVQAANPGSTVTVEELDGEGGKVIYDLKVQPVDGSKAFEAAVDAVTGELMATESDD